MPLWKFKNFLSNGFIQLLKTLRHWNWEGLIFNAAQPGVGRVQVLGSQKKKTILKFGL